MGQIKKQMQIIILDDKYLLISMIMSHYFYDLTYRLGQNYRNISVRFLVQLKTLKFASEINWPLSNNNRNTIIGEKNNTNDNFFPNLNHPTLRNAIQQLGRYYIAESGTYLVSSFESTAQLNFGELGRKSSLHLPS